MGSLGDLGSVSYSIVADDKSQEGLSSAKDRFVMTLGDIKTLLTDLSGPMSQLDEKYAQLEAESSRLAIMTGATAEEFKDLMASAVSVVLPL